MKWTKIILAAATFASVLSTGSAWSFDRNGVSLRAGVYINPIPITPFRPSYGHHRDYYNGGYNSYSRYGNGNGYGYGYPPRVSFNYSSGYVNDYSSRYIYRSSPEMIVRSIPETVYIERTVAPSTTYSTYPTPTYYGPSTPTRSEFNEPSLNSGAPLYCHNPDGYYPAVKNCPSGWKRVSQ